jgi:hypothetical protein
VPNDSTLTGARSAISRELFCCAEFAAQLWSYSRVTGRIQVGPERSGSPAAEVTPGASCPSEGFHPHAGQGPAALRLVGELECAAPYAEELKSASKQGLSPAEGCEHSGG